MTRILKFVCPVISTIMLAVAYSLGGLVWPVIGILIFGILVCVGLALRWEWFPPLSLFVSYGIAAFGLFIDLSSAALISAALFSLLAWDLAEFGIRLQKSSPEDDTSELEKLHLLRLVLPALVGVSLGAFALTVHLNPSFEWMVILMFFMIWGVGRVVNRLLKKES